MFRVRGWSSPSIRRRSVRTCSNRLIASAPGTADVGVSGVDVARQLLQAGHVDEIWIHLVPVLFGDGTRLYEQVGGRHLDLEPVEAISTPQATHLRYRLGRP